ncbi:MAG: hypothetical protein JWR83_229 [Aeromicrobium sp.]|nr:hypothetical protein [Aeromicrobium sp.]
MTINLTPRQIVALALTVTALLLTLAACGGGGTNNACGLKSGTSVAAVAYVSDGSVSTDQTYLADTTNWLLDEALQRKTMLSVATVGGSDAQVQQSACLNGVTFVAPGANDRLRTANTPAFLATMSSEISGLRHDFDASDPAATLRVGVSMLQSAPADKPRTLVIATDGLATAGCAALPSTVDPTDSTLVPRLVARCAEHLPDASGIDVLIVGIGHTGNLSSESVSFLTALNTALCEASHARTCSVPPTRPKHL